jgi:hypothetical protein
MAKSVTRLTAKRPSGRTKEHVEKAAAELEGEVRVNFNLPANTHLKLKLYAARNRTTITDLLKQAVDDMLKDADE